jgi:hypothetical protein
VPTVAYSSIHLDDCDGFSYRSLAMVKYLITLALLLVCTWSVAGEPASRTAYLLLRNGQTLHGTVHLQPEGYLVDLDSGVQLRLRRDSVTFRGESLHELYAFQRAGVNPRDITSTVRLADWCLRQGLLKEAELQIKHASTIRKGDRRIAHLQRRLDIQDNPPAHAASGENRATRPVVNSDQVSERIGQLSAETIQQFTSLIQPLMLNRCGTNQCHGPTAGSSLTLLRTAAGRPIPQRLTYRNLYYVLEQLGNKNPLESNLLVAPSAPHGKIDGGIFTDQEAVHMENLVKWCELAIQTIDTTLPASLPRPSSILAQPGVSPDPRPQQDTRPEERPPEPSTGLAPIPSANHDPFDPDPFNRLFHPRRLPAVHRSSDR